MAGKQKILVVDDNDDILKTYGLILDVAGYEVLTAGDGTGALDVVRTNTPDLILLDVHLPDMEGTEVSSLVKGNPETSDLPIIALTGSLSEDERKKIIDAGADELLVKPIGADLLTGTVEKYLGVK